MASIGRLASSSYAQTRHTLVKLREKYPNDPICLHGHSEGGHVVQVQDEKVAGIIVTGIHR